MKAEDILKRSRVKKARTIVSGSLEDLFIQRITEDYHITKGESFEILDLVDLYNEIKEN